MNNRIMYIAKTHKAKEGTFFYISSARLVFQPCALRDEERVIVEGSPTPAWYALPPNGSYPTDRSIGRFQARRENLAA